MSRFAEWDLAHVARHPDEGYNFRPTSKDRKLQVEPEVDPDVQRAMYAEFELKKRQPTIPIPIPRSYQPVHVDESSTRTSLNMPRRIDPSAFRVQDAGFLAGRDAGFHEGKQAARREIKAVVDFAEATLHQLEQELRRARNAVDELERKVKEASAAVDQLKLSRECLADESEF
jgi:hypothetical protein